MTKANMTAAASSKAIHTAIEQIAKKYGEINVEVQDCLVAIVIHAERFGDCSKAAALVAALPDKLRTLAIKYLMKVSPIGVRKNEDGTFKASFIKKDSKAYNPFDLDLAKATEWWIAPAKPDATPTYEMFGFLFDKLNKTLDSLITDKGLEKFLESDRKDVKACAAVVKQQLQVMAAQAIAARAANTTTGQDAELLDAVESVAA